LDLFVVKFKLKKIFPSLLAVLFVFSLISSLTPKVYAQSANLIANSSVESVDPENLNMPLKWDRFSWGDNISVFSYGTEANDGARGLNITVSNYVDGDAKWFFDAIPAKASTKYTFSDYYKSSVATDIVAKYILNTGVIKYTWLATIPASATWKKTVVNFTTPKNVQYMTIFHQISDNGTLTTDNFSLTTDVPVTPTPTPTIAPTATPSPTPVPTATPESFPVTPTPIPSAIPTPTPTPTPSPTIPPVVVPGNLILNPSMETPSAVYLTEPNEWFMIKSGTNNAAFTYNETGHTGARSTTIEATSFTNGGAAMAYFPVEVTGGKTYTFSDYYKSNVYTELEAEIALADGSIQYQYLKDIWPTVNWVKSSAQITVPATAASLRIYHLIHEVGILQTDDYSLVENAIVPVTGFNRGIVSVTLDDGLLSQYNQALPALTSNSLKATYYITKDLLGTPSYMSAAQVMALKNAGMEIGSHSVSHPHMATLNQTDLNYQSVQSKAYLDSTFGVNVTNFATPFGEYNDSVINTLMQTYTSHRSTDVGFISKQTFNKRNLIVQNVEYSTSVATVKSWIDKAKAEKLWLILVYHDTKNGGDAWSTTPARFKSEMAYLKQSGVTVKTVKDAILELESQF